MLLSIALAGAPVMLHGQAKTGWMQSFPVDVNELTTEGENLYFSLIPGSQLTLEGKEGSTPVRLVVSVLPDTAVIGGVSTRVVEERETRNDRVVEVSRNFMAFHPRTKDIYYFGEDVDTYKRGTITGHEGAWRHGTKNAHFGLMMPGAPAVGLRYYQELAPRVAMDRAEIVSLSERVTTPAGTFERCLKVRETTPLEMLSGEYKMYAPGVGLVQDGSLKLVSSRKLT